MTRTNTPTPRPKEANSCAFQPRTKGLPEPDLQASPWTWAPAAAQLCGAPGRGHATQGTGLQPRPAGLSPSGAEPPPCAPRLHSDSSGTDTLSPRGKCVTPSDRDTRLQLVLRRRARFLSGVLDKAPEPGSAHGLRGYKRKRQLGGGPRLLSPSGAESPRLQEPSGQPGACVLGVRGEQGGAKNSNDLEHSSSTACARGDVPFLWWAT